MEGERIELRTTYGALVAGGTVVQVAPLRTELAGDDGAALFVPNKVRDANYTLYIYIQYIYIHESAVP